MRAPRASARSIRSSTRNAAPSPITKPSRSTSNGREADAGSSWRPDRAPHAGEGGDGDGHDHGLGAAGQDDVGRAVPDQPGTVADGVRAGGAGGGDTDVGTR